MTRPLTSDDETADDGLVITLSIILTAASTADGKGDVRE